jgi:hypothetical protein
MLTREKMVAGAQRITQLLRDNPNPAGDRPISAKHLARLEELKRMNQLESEPFERRVAVG